MPVSLLVDDVVFHFFILEESIVVFVIDVDFRLLLLLSSLFKCDDAVADSVDNVSC